MYFVSNVSERLNIESTTLIKKKNRFLVCHACDRFIANRIKQSHHILFSDQPFTHRSRRVHLSLRRLHEASSPRLDSSEMSGAGPGLLPHGPGPFTPGHQYPELPGDVRPGCSADGPGVRGGHRVGRSGVCVRGCLCAYVLVCACLCLRTGVFLYQQLPVCFFSVDQWKEVSFSSL